MISDKPEVFMKAAAGVIFKEEDDRRFILLIQRSRDDHWPLHYEFPRGKCDKPIGEDVIKCLKREVKEETGLDVSPVKYINKFTYLADGGKRKTTCYNFLCKMDDPDQKIKLSKEHEDYKWIGEVGEVGLLLMPEQRKSIEKALNVDRSITMDPDNNFSTNDTIEEYLNIIQGKI
jgi:8-oxo-dGTP pyrophosphatase MutT (NUDIX family)